MTYEHGHGGEHEWRWQWKEFTSEPRRFTQPAWDSPIDPRGKRILIHAEQGFGDTLQFVRYAPMLAALGADVILECQPQLVPLLRNLVGVGRGVIARGDTLPEFDYRIALMSLPLLAFRTTLRTIPQKRAVSLSPAPSDVERWKRRLDAMSPAGPQVRDWPGMGGQVRIAMLDQCAFDDTLASKGRSACRSSEHLHFFSLQKLAGSEQAAHPPAGMRLTDFTPELQDFADTAALVQQLDLVICSRLRPGPELPARWASRSGSCSPSPADGDG